MHIVPLCVENNHLAFISLLSVFKRQRHSICTDNIWTLQGLGRGRRCSSSNKTMTWTWEWNILFQSKSMQPSFTTTLSIDRFSCCPRFTRHGKYCYDSLWFWFWRFLTWGLIWHLSQSSIRPSIYFSLIVKSRSNRFLEPTSTKQ